MSNLDMTALDSMDVSELAKLPAEMLLDLHNEIKEAQATLATRAATLADTIDRKYARRVKAALKREGKCYGTVTLTDGEITIKAELKRRTSWDQDKLARRIERLKPAERDALVTARFSITDAALKKASAPVRASLVAARTETVNAPDYTLKRAA